MLHKLLFCVILVFCSACGSVQNFDQPLEEQAVLLSTVESKLNSLMSETLTPDQISQIRSILVDVQSAKRYNVLLRQKLASLALADDVVEGVIRIVTESLRK